MGFFPSLLFASANVVTVSPAKIELTLPPGGEQSRVITVENTTPTPLSFTVSTENFEAGAHADDPFTLVDNGSVAAPLKEMLTVSKPSFELLSGEKMSIPVTVRIPKHTEPGGRYGSVVILFRPVLKSTGAQAIAVESRVGVLFFVRVSGEVKEEGHLVRFGLFNDARVLRVPSSETPLLFQIAYENTGAVHLNPYGRFTLVPFLVGTPRVITVDPWVVLPAQVRMREVAMPSTIPPGIYVAQLELNRGYGDVIDKSEVRFVVIPGPWGITIILVGLLCFFFLLHKSLRLSRAR
jgi:hypothetical protein